MTMQDLFTRLGGTIRFVNPPIPIREQDYQAFHPAFIDFETGEDRLIGNGSTPEIAAWEALTMISERIEEVLG